MERYQSFPLRALNQPPEGVTPHPRGGTIPSWGAAESVLQVVGPGEWLEGVRVPSHSVGNVGSPVSHRWLRCAD